MKTLKADKNADSPSRMGKKVTKRETDFEACRKRFVIRLENGWKKCNRKHEIAQIALRRIAWIAIN